MRKNIVWAITFCCEQAESKTAFLFLVLGIQKL